MLQEDLDQDNEIARKLHVAWPSFFATFGRLRPIQRLAIPPILHGDNVLVCAPTASGKTEAVCAPLIERYINKYDKWKILYICPTRALVNDLYYRLEKPLKLAGVTVARRTGEYKNNIRNNYGVIITTPESFDSMLCRGKDGSSHILDDAVAVVLDEIHLLLANPRGEQIRWLLERLRRLRNYSYEQNWVQHKDIQVIGLSATIEHPEIICKSFLGSNQIITTPGKRDIEVISNFAIGESSLLIKDYIKETNSNEKIIVFCNSRKRVDVLSTELQDLKDYIVIAHHGSLSRINRENSEKEMRIGKRVILCATSTIEIGIDIGDIDLIILDEPPFDVSSLLQRIGRGNRRNGKARVFPCSKSEHKVTIHRAMIDAAENGFLGVKDVGPEFAVIRQQFASYILQSPTDSRNKDSLFKLADHLVNRETSEKLLDHLISIGELKNINGKIKLGEYWLEKKKFGEIHCNIPSQTGYKVIDKKTGKQIAIEVEYVSGDIHIAGQNLEITNIFNRTIETNPIDIPSIGEHGYVQRPWVFNSGQSQAIQWYLGLQQNEWPVIHYKGISYVFHFGGSRREVMLDIIAKLSGIKVKEITPWFIAFKEKIVQKAMPFKTLSFIDIVSQLNNKVDSLEGILGRPVVNKKSLPYELRLEEIKGWLNIEDEMNIIEQSKWITNLSNETVKILETLITDK